MATMTSNRPNEEEVTRLKKEVGKNDADDETNDDLKWFALSGMALAVATILHGKLSITWMGLSRNEVAKPHTNLMSFCKIFMLSKI